MIVKAPAKINICLDIVGKRQDGYHLLHTIMEEIPIFDLISIEKANEITVACGDINNEENICYKAATSFFKYTNISGGAKIHIEKHIPTEAGLGGGSSDGASVIKALDELYKTNLSEKQMCEIAVTVGADVPFFIIGGCCEAKGIGEILTPIRPLPKCHILVVKPQFSVSTKEAFLKFDNCPPKRHMSTDQIIDALNKGDLNFVCKNIFNVMEISKEIEDIKQQMLSAGALGSAMTGSGSAVFGIFDDLELASECKKSFSNNMEFMELFSK